MKKILLFILPLLLQAVLLGQASYTKGPQLNTARTSSFGTKLNDGRILIVGGHGFNFLRLNTAEIWNPATNTFQQYTMSDYRDQSSLNKLSNGKILIAGGMSSDLGVGQLASMELFNPADNSFTPVCNLSAGAKTMVRGAELTSGKVLLAGCWFDQTSASYGDVYDPQSNTCTPTGALVIPRAMPILFPMSDGSALLMGGYGPYGGPMPETIEIYKPADNQFTVFRNTLLADDTLWFPSYGNVDGPDNNKMKNGKYLLLAGKSENSIGHYSLITIDPVTKTIERLHTTPELPDYNLNTGDSAYVYCMVLDSAKDLCYLISLKSTNTSYYESSIKAVDLKTNILYSMNERFVIPYGCWDTPRLATGDGKIFIVGGSISNNFDCLDSTFFFNIQVPTGVNDKPNMINSYSLSQNYPNPFNPATKIRFTLPESGFVTLKIYDVTGREVSTIINGRREAGNYEVTFDASKLASGIYVYKLAAKNFSGSRKMVLIK